MTRALPGQVTVVRRDKLELNPGWPPAGSPSLVERSARSEATGAGRTRDEELERMLLELTKRAPAPAVGPSHWWG
jgi:hypothetical protein